MARRCLMVYIVAGWLCCFRTSVVSQINVRKRKRRRKRKQRSLNKFAENTGDGTGGGYSDHSMYRLPLFRGAHYYPQERKLGQV